MKKTIVTILLTVLPTIVAILFILEVKAQKDQLKADKIETIDSEILNESRKLLVHLPKDYNPHNPIGYPILIALDGTSHDHDVVNAAYVLNFANLLSEIIIIGIPNTNRNRDLTPEYLMKDNLANELGEADQFLLFLEKEVIPLIEKKYNISGYRMISGHSRGGLFSFYALLEKPELFDAYFCYSPSFWRNDNLIVTKAQESLSNKKLINKYLYLSLGDGENEKMKLGFDAITSLLENHKVDSLNFYSNYTLNAVHGNNAYFSIPPALNAWQNQR